MKKTLEISATDVFEYVKCPAFFKQYINSGKLLSECYDPYYHSVIFQYGKDFEAKEVKKLPLLENTQSLADAIRDETISAIRINPKMIIKREIKHSFKKFKKFKIYVIGIPDLIIRYEHTKKCIPLDFKTSLSYLNSIRFQLFHYCYILKQFDTEIPYLGVIESAKFKTRLLNLKILERDWYWIIYQITLIKSGKSSERKLQREDLVWTKDCINCFFYSTCEPIVRSDVRIRDLPGVKDSRNEVIKNLGINNIDELAKIEPNIMWKKIQAYPEGKVKFGSEFTVRQIIGTARALLENSVIKLSKSLKLLDIKENDVFFDCEYISKTKEIFSISAGVAKKDGTISLKNWFANTFNECDKIVKIFYEYLVSEGIERAIGWSINSADLPMLKEYDPLPSGIDYRDLFLDIKQNLALPVLSYRLKPVSKYIFGAQFEDQIKSGFYAPHYYNQFLETGNLEYKEAIIEYNNKDVIQTYEIANWYDELCKDIIPNIDIL